MDKADQIAPVVAVLHWRERAHPVETPDLMQIWFGADAEFIDCP